MTDTTSSAESNVNSDLTIVVHFARALGHLIRTPLAVISSDLQYLKSQSDDVGIERSLEQVSRIVSSLSLSELRIPMASTAVDFRHLASGLRAAAEPQITRPSIEDGDALKSATMRLSKLANWQIIFESADQIKLSTTIESSSGATHFFLFSALFNGLLLRETIDAPIVDVVFGLHGLTTDITIERQSVEVTIRHAPTKRAHHR